MNEIATVLKYVIYSIAALFVLIFLVYVCSRIQMAALLDVVKQMIKDKGEVDGKEN